MDDLTPFETATGPIPEIVARKIRETSYLPGWCERQKAYDMAGLVTRERPKICVEIGVFGGRSLLPVALALAQNDNGGVVYAIDPWLVQACKEGTQPDTEAQYWPTVDLANVRAEFLSSVINNKVFRHVKIIEARSHCVVQNFDDESIDIIHIDGNHSEETSLRDVQLYLPKVKKGGYIWLDDADWASIRSAVRTLDATCDDCGNWTRWRLYRKN